jgi:sterol-4alpha-carboxylate 3-dehydrogenase (decarboxylating)
VRQEDIFVIPKWVGMLLGFMSEWFVWLISGGKRSANMTVDGIRFSTMTRTLNIDKAKRRLRYQPKVSMQEGIERGVRWFMEEQEKKHEAGK